MPDLWQEKEVAVSVQHATVESGSGTTACGFTGERWEAYSRLVFLRARYYQPATGRFLTQDPWPGVAQRPVSRHAYLYASANPVAFIDPLGLYDCSAWPPDLVGLCRILDSSLLARYAFYNAVVVGTSQMGWADASMLTAHYLYGSGQAMYLGSRMVKLIERDAAQPINEWRIEYLSWASEQMGGQAGKLPEHADKAFLSRASLADINRFVQYADRVYPTGEEVHIALGGFWLDRDYAGTVSEHSGGKYHISLWTTFHVDKRWSFKSNEDMGYSADRPNPPAAFNIAAALEGLLDQPPFIGLLPRPRWDAPSRLVSPGDNPWIVFIPDEWGLSLDTAGLAASFDAKGTWRRCEAIVAVDRDCDGWQVRDIVGKPRVIYEELPVSTDFGLTERVHGLYRNY